MSTDTIADMLTTIRNGYLASREYVVVPKSRLKESLAKIMVQEKYLKKVEEIKDSQGFPQLKLTLLYINSQPALHSIKRVSKPGLRIYRKAKDIQNILSGYGLAILSTSKGIMTDKQAKEKNLGGEVLCELW